MIDINEVAGFFLLCPDEDSGDVLTHLKLQKLAYYAQGWNLAIHSRPLVADDFEAWADGPVARRLYDRFTCYGSDPIPREEANFCVNDEQVLGHLSEVWQVYGEYTPEALEKLACSERPWIEARSGLGESDHSSTPISHDVMQEFYRRILTSG